MADKGIDFTGDSGKVAAGAASTDGKIINADGKFSAGSTIEWSGEVGKDSKEAYTDFPSNDAKPSGSTIDGPKLY